MEQQINLPSAPGQRERSLTERPIELPGNPYVDRILSFGGDEGAALFFSLLGTYVMSGKTEDSLQVAVAGPVSEKAGFFFIHLARGVQRFRKSPPETRGGIFPYLRQALKAGGVSMAEDALFHDPIYTYSMVALLNALPNFNQTLISLGTFISAAALVAIGEVAIHEARFRRQIQSLHRLGFESEPYLESRFYIKDGEPRRIIDDLSGRFKLPIRGRGEYHDRYFHSKLDSYNFRCPTLRLRQRTRGEGWMQTLQVVYTRASRMARKKEDQFNYFPTQKNKLYYELREEMPWELEGIKDARIRKFCQRTSKGYEKDVHFIRDVALDPEGILVTVDEVDPKGEDPYYVLELKAYADRQRKLTLLEAMRHVMDEYKVIQTTHSKRALTSAC